MIGNGSQLQVTDNSGAKVAQCINQSGKSWGIGDAITVSIKKAQPRSKVSAGQVRMVLNDLFVQAGGGGGVRASMHHASSRTRDG